LYSITAHAPAWAGVDACNSGKANTWLEGEPGCKCG
jgi:hypothetical protein